MQANINEVPEKDALHYKLLVRAYKNGNDVIARGAPHIIISVLPDEYAWKAEDGNTALAYFELSAHAHNVGCVWAGYFTSAARKCKPLRDALGIKDDEYIVICDYDGMITMRNKVLQKENSFQLWMLKLFF